MNIAFQLKILVVLLFEVFLIPSPCFAWTGRVVSISDGDTIKVLHEGKEELVRLYGIDAPEKDQDAGLQAKDLIRALVTGRNIEIQPIDVDSYGRTVGLVSIDGILLNELMIRNGYAWVYHHFCRIPSCSDWIKLEREARRHKKGMWGDANIMPPWEWRQRNEQGAARTKPQTMSSGQRAKAPSDTSQSARQFKCDGRIYCSQMRSCQEATFFLNTCPGTKMDGNNDGIPCERQWCK